MLTHVSQRAFLDAVLRSDFTTFIGATFNVLNPATPYRSNWHIRAIAYHLELVRLGVIKRLIINMPPRSLKSVSASVAFTAWLHGHDPAAHIIAASYGQDLSTKFHNDSRRLLESDVYRRLFPKSRIDPRKNSEYEVLFTGTGTRLATSVGGPITGRGADYIILDDVLKPQDAFSESRRKSVHEWYGTTILSRLNNKQTGAIVVVGQRLHEDDLIGFLLERDPGLWTVLNLPAIALADQQVAIGDNRYHTRLADAVLHAEREPREVLDRIAREIGSQAFAAQYQQCPIPFGGHTFLRQWLTYYETVPDRGTGDVVIQSWDTASKTGSENDYSVCTTWLFVDG